MSIHYKFRSSLDYDTLRIDGQSISLADLRDSIMAHKKISKTSAYTLEITDAQTKKVYTDERALIPKNSSVIVKRVPSTSHGGVASYAPLSDKDVQPAKKQLSLDKLTKVGDLANANATEDDKIAAMMTQSGEEYAVSSYSRRTVPPGSYTCFKCGQAGHFIRSCPLGNSSDAKFPVRSTWRNYAGIPKDHMSQLMKEEEKKRIAILEQAGQTMGAYRPVVASDVIDHEQVPQELQCPLCKKLFTDAVLIPCCGTSYCDECIRNFLIEKEFICPNCQTYTSPDQLVANVQLRKAAEKHRNQLEGVNKGVITVRNTDEEPSGGATPDRQENASLSEKPSETKLPPPVSSQVTPLQQESSPYRTDASKAAEPQKDVNDRPATEGSGKENTLVPTTTQETVSTDVKQPSGVAVGVDSNLGIQISLPSSLATPSVSLPGFNTQSLSYSAASHIHNVMTSNPAYSDYLKASALPPRLTASIPPGPVLSQVPGLSLTSLVHSKPAFPHVNLLPSRMKTNPIMMGSVALNLPGVGGLLAPRPPVLDPMMALDNQRPLSEQEFYRAQKHLKNFSRRRQDSGERRPRDNTKRYDFDAGRRKNEQSRRLRERDQGHGRGRSRERLEHRNQPKSQPVKRRRRSKDTHRRPDVKYPKLPKSPDKASGSSRSPRYSRRSPLRSRSWSLSRSRSRSRSKSLSRSPSRSFSRSLSRSRSRSSSLPGRSRSSSRDRSISPEQGSYRESQQSLRGRSERSGSNHSLSLNSGKSGSVKSTQSSLRKWSTSPEEDLPHSPTPDDAISLSPSSQLGFSDSEPDQSKNTKNGTGVSKHTADADAVGKRKSRHKSTGVEDGKNDSGKDASKRAKKHHRTKEERRAENSEVESDKRSVSKKEVPSDKRKEKQKSDKVEMKREVRVKSKAESVVVSKPQKSTDGDAEKKIDRKRESKRKESSSHSKSSKKSEKSKSKAITERSRDGEKPISNVERRVKSSPAMDSEEQEGKIGLRISKDKDGTVREVLTSRARKRVKEDTETNNDGIARKKASKNENNEKVRIVCVVEPEEKKKKKVVSADQRRVVLSSSANKPEVEVATEEKSSRSGQKKAKNKKHKSKSIKSPKRKSKNGRSPRVAQLKTSQMSRKAQSEREVPLATTTRQARRRKAMKVRPLGWISPSRFFMSCNQ